MVLISTLLWSGSAHAQFTILPHLQNLRRDGVSIVWLQDVPGPATVVVDGVRYDSAYMGREHQVDIRGLEPDTDYAYTVEVGDITTGGSFATAPENILAPFRFVVYGDTRSGHDAHRDVIGAILEEGPLDFVVHTGDMISSGEIETQWYTFFDIEEELLRNTPLYPTVGNHEADDFELPFNYRYFLAPPTDTSGNEAYYSFVYANTAFIVLDGHVNAVSRLFGLWYDFDDEQRAWLMTVLERYDDDPTIQHIFVVNHEPPYSSKPGRSGSHALRTLLPTFLSYGVDGVLAGHDHYLERGESPGGIRYFIIGGGGAPLYGVDHEGDPGPRSATALPWLDDAHRVDFSLSSYGYMVVDVCNGQVDIEIKNRAGTLLDSQSWNTGDIEPSLPDGGPGDGGPGDTGPEDTGPEDTGPEDTGPEDTGPGDAGATDGDPDSVLDAGTPDDGGPLDADALDADEDRDSPPGSEPEENEEGDDVGGCSCRAAHSRHTPLAGLLALLAIAFVSRRF